MKIKDYKVLIADKHWSDESKKINELVKQHLEKGWSLQGGIATIVTNENNVQFAQAVIMYEE